jgi:hypothetical protein
MIRFMLTVALIFGILILLRGCPDVQTEHVGVSYLNAYAAPGGAATLEISTKQSVAGQIENVSVTAPGLDIPEPVVLLPYTPGGWGQIVEKSDLGSTMREMFIGDAHHPATRVQVAIPQSAKPQGWTPVNLHVGYVLATWAGPGMYDTKQVDETIAVPLAVVEPGKEWLTRAGDVAKAAAILLGLALVSRLVFDGFGGAKLGVLQLVRFLAVLAWIYPALRWALWPMEGYLGWPTPWVRQVFGLGLLIGSWVVAGILVKRCLRRPAGDSQPFLSSRDLIANSAAR